MTDLNERRAATGLLDAIERRIERLIQSRTPSIRYGIVFEDADTEARTVSVQLDGQSEPSGGFVYGQVTPVVGDFVRVIIQPSGDRWVDEVLVRQTGGVGDHNHDGTYAPLVVDSGTSFPASPANGDRFYRTDLTRWYFYAGTRWLSLELGRIVVPILTQGNSEILSATTSPYHRGLVPDLAGGSDLWLENSILSFYVAAGGTALGASHKWVLTVGKIPSGGTLTTIATHNVDSGSSAVVRRDAVSIQALLDSGTQHLWLGSTATKTGTPGTFQGWLEITYRITN